MLKKQFLFCYFLLLSVVFQAAAQDTIVVPSLNFKSSAARDTMVYFPNGKPSDYEKVILKYTLRCKNALVSTSSNRNLGCGEWDYSCNTYLTDSTRVDSSRAFAKSHIISGFKGDYYEYSTKPTYSYTQYNQQQTTVSSSVNEKAQLIGNGTQVINHPFVTNVNAAKAYYLISANEIGTTIGNVIHGLEIDLNTTQEAISFLRIKLKNTTQTVLEAATMDVSNLTEVYFVNTTVDKKGFNRFMFHTPFGWDGKSNVLVEVSYNNSAASAISNTTANGTASATTMAAYSNEHDTYLELKGDTRMEIPTATLPDTLNEITIGFWLYGNPDFVPAYDTDILEGVDGKNNRQINLHLPWSDANVYWDCGGDGKGGFDRVNKAALATDLAGKWNYWTFTKSTTTKTMRIYLNGVLWTSGTNKTRPIIGVKKLVMGQVVAGNYPYYGYIDDLSIWKKELSLTEIKALMFQKIDDKHSRYDDLLFFFNFNEKSASTASDNSKNKVVGTFKYNANRKSFKGIEINKQLVFDTYRPNLKLFSGSYTRNNVAIKVLDSIPNTPNLVRSFYVDNQNNLKENPLKYYWKAGDVEIKDEAGNKVADKTIASEGDISIEELQYYTRRPMKYELTSFVTPYGIGLDYGKEGKTWYFDVTDFAPILNGTKRLTVERGGQNQEEMDLKFLFIKGTPPRTVQNITQIWPVDQTPYTSIVSNRAYEPRAFRFDASIKAAKVRAAITGHGQEGEFNPQIHFINVNGGTKELEWQVWKECANNPVYPQGGTWIYDRAGWCPGMPTDIKELDITSFLTTQKDVTVDYGVNTASGDSRYIVNQQLITYGAPNFQNDAAVTKIVRPTFDAEQGRFNPACMSPEIEITNNGEQALQSLEITYGIEGATPSVYNWTGNLGFLKTARVVLPSFVLSNWGAGKTFSVSVSKPNGKTDEYANNNTMKTKVNNIPQWGSAIVIQMKTNNAPTETSWTLTDQSGNVIRSRKNGLTANKTYLDTISNLNGCYQWKISDSGDDGISFWANSDGAGTIGIRNLGGPTTFLQPDFGKEINYQFIAGNTIATNEEIRYTPEVLVYPNPTSGDFTVQIEGITSAATLTILDMNGRVLRTQAIPASEQLHKTYQFDMEQLVKGIYFVKIQQQDRLISTKFVKM